MWKLVFVLCSLPGKLKSINSLSFTPTQDMCLLRSYLDNLLGFCVSNWSFVTFEATPLRRQMRTLELFNSYSVLLLEKLNVYMTVLFVHEYLDCKDYSAWFSHRILNFSTTMLATVPLLLSRAYNKHSEHCILYGGLVIWNQWPVDIYQQTYYSLKISLKHWSKDK